MKRTIAESAVKMLHEYLTKEEVCVVEAVRPKNPDHVGIRLTGDAKEVMVGAALAMSIAVGHLDRKIEKAKKDEKALLLRMRKELLDQIANDVVLNMPVHRELRDEKEILY